MLGFARRLRLAGRRGPRQVVSPLSSPPLLPAPPTSPCALPIKQVNHALKLNCWVNTVERQRFSPPYVDKDADEASAFGWAEPSFIVLRCCMVSPPYMDKDADEAHAVQCCAVLCCAVCHAVLCGAMPPHNCTHGSRAARVPARTRARPGSRRHPCPCSIKLTPHILTLAPALPQKFEWFLERLQEALTPDGIEELRWVRCTCSACCGLRTRRRAAGGWGAGRARAAAPVRLPTRPLRPPLPACPTQCMQCRCGRPSTIG